MTPNRSSGKGLKAKASSNGIGNEAVEESVLEIILIIAGIVAFAALSWHLHRRFGTEPPQTHSNAKPLETHDQKPLIAQGLESLGRGK